MVQKRLLLVQVVGKDLAVNLVKYYIHADYAAGRHQVRVDMLNKMLH